MFKFGGLCIRINEKIKNMMKKINTLLMTSMAAVMLASCATDNKLPVPVAPLEECVYMGDKTEFAVWSPDSEAAQLRLYNTASDEAAFKTVDMLKVVHKGGVSSEVLENIKTPVHKFIVIGLVAGDHLDNGGHRHRHGKEYQPKLQLVMIPKILPSALRCLGCLVLGFCL